MVLPTERCNSGVVIWFSFRHCIVPQLVVLGSSRESWIELLSLSLSDGAVKSEVYCLEWWVGGLWSVGPTCGGPFLYWMTRPEWMFILLYPWPVGGRRVIEYISVSTITDGGHPRIGFEHVWTAQNNHRFGGGQGNWTWQSKVVCHALGSTSDWGILSVKENAWLILLLYSGPWHHEYPCKI